MNVVRHLAKCSTDFLRLEIVESTPDFAQRSADVPSEGLVGNFQIEEFLDLVDFVEH